MALVEGEEQVVFNKNEILALYGTLQRTDAMAAEKLKAYVTGIWELTL